MMFTFTRLGRMGRFGNQLFQIAATIGMAAKHETDYVFPKWEHSHLFKTPLPQFTSPMRPDLTLGHESFHYIDMRVIAHTASVIDLRGYFQSEKFFLHCASVIREYFEPTPVILTALNTGYGSILRNNATCIMVVRRGDYMTNQNNWVLQTADFYAEAMAQFDADTTFFVTSDDNEWCYQNIRGPNVTVLPQPAWIHNFFLGTLCQHAIIANSTFGWWFAYLNKNAGKRVVAARRWFGPDLAHNDTTDLLPAGWLTV